MNFKLKWEIIFIQMFFYSIHFNNNPLRRLDKNFNAIVYIRILHPLFEISYVKERDGYGLLEMVFTGDGLLVMVSEELMDCEIKGMYMIQQGPL